MPTWVQPTIEVMQATGMLGMLAWALYGGTSKVWVYGWMYHELKAERDAWQAEAAKWERLATDALARLKEHTSS